MWSCGECQGGSSLINYNYLLIIDVQAASEVYSPVSGVVTQHNSQVNI